MLRTELKQRDMEVYNPRGERLRSIPDVQKLLGLMLHLIDPDKAISDNDEMRLTNEAKRFFDYWRHEAKTLIDLNPIRRDGRRLRDFIRSFQSCTKESSALKLVFDLVAWMPRFQKDPEAQVWLSTITQAISDAAHESPYEMRLVMDGEEMDGLDHFVQSRRNLIGDLLVPIAEDRLDVDEDAVLSPPRDRLQMMTIHQAKGLEFPLVIVDVGSRFNIHSPFQRPRRFPEHPSPEAIAEDDVEPHLPTRLRGWRSGLDRAFDDLARLYYVAFSRAQSALMLVGSANSLNIPNVALGWSRESRDWMQNRAAFMENIQLV